MIRPVIIFMAGLLAFSSLNAQSLLKLDKNWRFRQSGTKTWYKASVPGTIHTDLLEHQLIPDPFYGINESKVQWVEEKEWEYETVFRVTPASLNKKYVELECEGLDTYAHVFLNGKLVLKADNMFRQWTVNIKPFIKPGDNILLVKFFPAAKKAKELKSLQNISYPDNERVFVRKAQYHFGWDWAPRLVTCGIWKEMRIKAFQQYATDEKINRANQYRLVREDDSIGQSFYFTRNGKPVFIKGTNWIPPDSFLPRAKRLKKYEQLIRAAKEANINMLRVWGGGIYEDDEFYRLCDQYGIMVWQDFMFAGGLYPGDPEFLKNVEEEIRYQVKRLRKFDCIAIWCGNNEIEEAWFNWGWQKQFNYSVNDSLRLWNDYKKIFHELIPGILKELDPERPYWPSSPSTGWGRDSAYKIGDVHYWGVWWGKEPVELYNHKVGRFNSEYGMQGMPSMKTIDQFSETKDLDTSSAVMKVHQKHPFGYENLKLYIERKFRTPKNFEDLVYVSQLMQADAIKTAIEAHRRNKPITMGTMFWQWNDCWPVTSWSAIDYYGRKKALYFEVKRSYRVIHILPFVDEDHYWMKIVSDADSTIKFTMRADFIHLKDGVKNSLLAAGKYELKPGEVFTGRSKRDILKEDATNACIRFRIVETDTKKLISENFLFLVPPKDFNLDTAKITWRFLNDHEMEIQSDKFAYGVFVDLPDGVNISDNYFHMVPNEKKIIRFQSKLSLELIRKKVRITSLSDTY